MKLLLPFFFALAAAASPIAAADDSTSLLRQKRELQEGDDVSTITTINPVDEEARKGGFSGSGGGIPNFKKSEVATITLPPGQGCTLYIPEEFKVSKIGAGERDMTCYESEGISSFTGKWTVCNANPGDENWDIIGLELSDEYGPYGAQTGFYISCSLLPLWPFPFSPPAAPIASGSGVAATDFLTNVPFPYFTFTCPDPFSGVRAEVQKTFGNYIVPVTTLPWEVDFDGDANEFQSFWGVPSATLFLNEDLSSVALNCWTPSPN